MNLRIVTFMIAVIMAAVALAITACGTASYLLQDPRDAALKLTLCGIMIFLLSFVLAFCMRPKNEIDRKMGMREGFAIVGLSWFAATFCGMFPYIIVCGFSWYDAIFETASGFSTTGASVVDSTLVLMNGERLANGVESLPRGILLWRSMTQWLGGMGIVVLSLAIVPLMKIGGQSLYNAEVSGIKSMQSKIAPRIADSAKILWIVYVVMTLFQIILLRLGNMGWFDSVCHSMTTLSTGGFSTKNSSIAYWQSDYIHWVIIVFMFLSGCNFVLHYRFLMRKSGSNYFKDEEFRFYTVIVVLFSLIIAGILTWQNGLSSCHISLRDAVFQVISFITTTGFCTADYSQWHALPVMLLFLTMFICACGGSTTGGIKCVRILLVGKYALSEIRRCLFPHLVQDIRLNDERCEFSTIQKTIGFCTLFMILFLVFAAILTCLLPGDVSMETALSASLTCLANVGPGFGQLSSAYTFSWMTPPAKLLLAFEMILGRLELYTVLVLFLPSFWKK